MKMDLFNGVVTVRIQGIKNSHKAWNRNRNNNIASVSVLETRG